MGIEVRRAGSRFVTHDQGRTTAHSFSFGSHYDLENLGFESMLAHNDELLAPGTGYDAHRHAEVEIVTVVLAGMLRHHSEVGSGVLGAGEVQRLSAGSGVTHAETAADPVVGARFLQTWLRPTAAGGDPSYDTARGPVGNGLLPLVGGAGPIGVGSAAELHDGRLAAGQSLTLPDVAALHLFVVDGTVGLDSESLGVDDAARIRDRGGLTVTSSDGGRFLLWAM